MRAIFLFLFLCTTLLSAEEIGGVSYSLEFPGEKWKVGSTYTNEQQEMVTYVLEKDSSQKWSELFTAQQVKGLQLTPNSFYEMFLQQLKVLVPGKNIQSKVLQQDNQQLLAEWWIDAKSDEDQHEWVRLMQNQGSLVVLRYTTKSLDQLEKAREKGNSFLQSAKILH
jgi:hypothetical protein